MSYSVTQFLVYIRVRCHPMSSSSPDAGEDAMEVCSLVFYPFPLDIWVPWIFQIYICLLQLKQYGWWWNSCAQGKKRKSWDKTLEESIVMMVSLPSKIHLPPAVQEQMCNQLICRCEALHASPLLCPPQDLQKRIWNISQWRKSLVAIGIVTFARLHKGRKLLLLSRSLQHQGISASQGREVVGKQGQEL